MPSLFVSTFDTSMRRKVIFASERLRHVFTALEVNYCSDALSRSAM